MGLSILCYRLASSLGETEDGIEKFKIRAEVEREREESFA